MVVFVRWSLGGVSLYINSEWTSLSNILMLEVFQALSWLVWQWYLGGFLFMLASKLIKPSLEDSLVGFFRSARSRVAHRFSIGFISGDWLGHNKQFILSFCQPILCLFRSMAESSILHEKDGLWYDDAAFHYEMQTTTPGPEYWCIFQHWHFRHRPQAQNVRLSKWHPRP